MPAVNNWEEPGEGGGRERVYGNSVLSAQFVCEPKTALKYKAYHEQQMKIHVSPRLWVLGPEIFLEKLFLPLRKRQDRRKPRDLEDYTQDRKLEIKMFPPLSFGGLHR